jgi:hypothetical protein
MHGNDIADAMLETYGTYLRSKKWWYRLFHFLVDMGLNNAFLLYRMMVSISHPTKKTPFEHSEFLIGLINALLEQSQELKPKVVEKEPKRAVTKLKKNAFPHRLQKNFEHFPVYRMFRILLAGWLIS